MSGLPLTNTNEVLYREILDIEQFILEHGITDWLLEMIKIEYDEKRRRYRFLERTHGNIPVENVEKIEVRKRT